MHRIETEYNKNTDTTYIFNVGYFGGLLAYKNIVGFYYGSPDEKQTNDYIHKTKAVFDIWGMLKEYEKPIYKNRLKNYLSENNKNLQESIINIGGLDSALNYCKIYNYENFSNVIELLEYYGDYAFIYEREIYLIMFENAFDVYRNKK